jgi:hypothetical protein
MKWFSLLMTLLFSPCLFAQADVVVISSKGKIWHQTNTSDSKNNLFPGQKIKATGSVLLDDDSQVTLLSSGKTYRLFNSGKHDLALLIPSQPENKMGFASRFWSFLTDGLINSDNQKSLDQYHKQHMSVAGGVKGFAGAGEALNSILPTYGKLVPGIIEFQWNPVKSETVIYQFDLTDVASNTLIYRALYRPSLVELDLRPLALNDQNQYIWRIRALDKNTNLSIDSIDVSEAFDFQFVLDPDPIIAAALENVEGYNEADEISRSWMEAIAMEQEGFLYMAYRRYLKLRLIHPDDLLIKKLFAGFLVRQNQLDAARDILSP